MNISAIQNLDDGMSNISCSGIATYVKPAVNRTGEKNGEPYDFWTQFVVIKDSSGDIGVNLNLGGDPSLAVVKGKRISIEKGTVGSYTDNGKLRKSLKARLATTNQQELSNTTTQQKANSNNEDMTRIRSMALSYSKDLVAAGIMELNGLRAMANEFTAYIMTGRWFATKNEQPEPDQSIQDDNQLDSPTKYVPNIDDIPF